MSARTTIGVAVTCLTLMMTVATVRADESSSPPQVNAPVETIGLFKNGLAVVRRSLTVPVDEHHTFDITDLPEPVHGTFWIESTADVTVTVTESEVPVQQGEALPGMNNQSLSGAHVTVYFKQEGVPNVQGVVAEPPAPKRQWDRNYGWSRPRHTYWWAGNWSSRSSTSVPQQSAQHLVIERDGEQYLVDPDSVAFLRVNNRSAQQTEQRPVMRVNINNTNDAQQDVQLGILYLTRGASWAPSYSVDMTDTSQVTLRQKAVIRNELEDIENAEILLISGFPNVEFGHVLSPMAPASSLATFFRALGTENRLSHSSRGDVMGQTVMSNAPADDTHANIAPDHPTLDGDDLHYESIGRHTLAAGETLMVNMAQAVTNATRVVRWKRADDRDKWGRRRNSNPRNRNAASD